MRASSGDGLRRFGTSNHGSTYLSECKELTSPRQVSADCGIDESSRNSSTTSRSTPPANDDEDEEDDNDDSPPPSSVAAQVPTSVAVITHVDCLVTSPPP